MQNNQNILFYRVLPRELKMDCQIVLTYIQSSPTKNMLLGFFLMFGIESKNARTCGVCVWAEHILNISFNLWKIDAREISCEIVYFCNLCLGANSVWGRESVYIFVLIDTFLMIKINAFSSRNTFIHLILYYMIRWT